MLSTKHLLVCFKKCYFHAIYPLGFQTLFNRGDLDRPTSQCCSTHVTDFEIERLLSLRPKTSPSDLKKHAILEGPYPRAANRMSYISPIDHRCQKSVFLIKYGYATDFNGKTIESRKPVRSLPISKCEPDNAITGNVTEITH